MRRALILITLSVLSGSVLAGCTPTVRLEGGQKPIEITLNINAKIDQEVRVKLEKDVQELIKSNPGVF